MTTVTLPALSPVSSLEAYVQAVNTVPLLTAEREVELGRRLKESGDLTAARDLVLSHLRLVVAVARNYMGYGLPQADLIQEGNVGLMKAVRRFDPTRGVRLASFAIHWIKAEIHEYILRNWRLVKVATTKAQRKLFFNLRSLKSSTATLSPAEVKTIAKTLAVKESDVVEMEQRLQGHDITIDPAPEDGEDRPGPIAFLADAAEGPAEIVERRQSEGLETEGLARALAALDDRSRRIVKARWLAEGDAKTLHELADEFGVSAERIRQIEAKALQKMKGHLAALR
ncbi:MAG TPA: RNA polymerase sigma factor RpoH [Usitatibacteraceae bacterium]|jgi:RNA polymerase sigma-32 factor|nr:RNA polymerase sigma factor RpoH [Usitatibacteraceae bacterium]HRA22528.1 RNA polymerase sigma factor RpoH [Usitatibacteraceae bacterium]